MELIGTILIGIILISLGGIGWFISIYNGLIKAKNRVEETLKQIDVRLQNRYDLLPDLIQAVEKATSTDEKIQTKIAEVRTASENAKKGGELTLQNAKRAAELDQTLTNAISAFRLTVEDYPELGSQESIQSFMNQNEKIEEMIAASRQIYNATVREYNESIQVFPSNIVAGIFNFTRAEYYEAAEAARADISPDWNAKMTTK